MKRQTEAKDIDKEKDDSHTMDGRPIASFRAAAAFLLESPHHLTAAVRPVNSDQTLSSRKSRVLSEGSSRGLRQVTVAVEGLVARDTN